MAQPTIRIQSLASDGIHLLGQDDPEFIKSLPAGRSKEFDKLAPTAVLLKNDTDKALVAYHVHWLMVDANGKQDLSDQVVCDFRCEAPARFCRPTQCGLSHT